MIHGLQITYPLLITIIIALVAKLLTYKKDLREEKERFWQFFLNIKSLNSLIVSNLQAHHFNPPLTLIEEVIDYFKLEDILLVRHSDLQQNCITTVGRGLPLEKLQEIMSAYYEKQGTMKLEHVPVILDFFHQNYGECLLYIFPPQEIEQESIICIQRRANFITNNTALELGTILNYLKLFLRN